MVAGLRKRGKTDVRQITVSTDFETHRLWVNEPTDLYNHCHRRRGPPTCTTGAYRPTKSASPASPFIRVFTDMRKIAPPSLATHGLANDRPVLLQLAGGFGVGPIEELYRGLLSLPMPLQIVGRRRQEHRRPRRTFGDHPAGPPPREKFSASPTRCTT